MKHGHIWIGISISVALLIYLFARVNYGELWLSFASADLSLLLIATLTLGGTLLMRAWRGPSPEQSSAPPAAAHAPAVATQASPSSAPRESAAISSAAPAELIAIRDVWVRATVDGQRVLERELEAGTRVPLRGRTIVIRAGNAGAVRMVVDGQDRGTLGGEGVVLTRTYTSTTAQ